MESGKKEGQESVCSKTDAKDSYTLKEKRKFCYERKTNTKQIA